MQIAGVRGIRSSVPRLWPCEIYQYTHWPVEKFDHSPSPSRSRIVIISLSVSSSDKCIMQQQQRLALNGDTPIDKYIPTERARLARKIFQTYFVLVPCIPSTNSGNNNNNIIVLNNNPKTTKRDVTYRKLSRATIPYYRPRPPSRNRSLLSHSLLPPAGEKNVMDVREDWQRGGQKKK